jgi:DNA repair exonuclease SbcCD ATPase subunit
MTDYTDLIKRLREWDYCWPAPGLEHTVESAADAIETLKRERGEMEFARDQARADCKKLSAQYSRFVSLYEAEKDRAERAEEERDEFCRSAQRGWEKLGFRLEDLDEAIARAERAEAALRNLITDIEDYERVNNLAPSPGKPDCWQSVTHARAVLAKIESNVK